jgi:hypothetical protein
VAVADRSVKLTKGSKCDLLEKLLEIESDYTFTSGVQYSMNTAKFTAIVYKRFFK